MQGTGRSTFRTPTATPRSSATPAVTAPAVAAPRSSATSAQTPTNVRPLQSSSADAGNAPSNLVRNPASTSNSSSRGVQAVTTQVAELAVTAPVGITHPVIKQYQAFIRQFAWIAVREMASMRAGEQKKHLMLQYKAFINMFLDQTMQYTNDSFPQLPVAFQICDRIEAFNILMQSTSRRGSIFSEDALYNKVKKDVQTMLKFMAEWCRICTKNAPSDRRPGVFVPAEPPSGKDRDWAFNQIMQTWWRTAQCLRIYKLRSANSHLPENTPQAIRAALMSYNFAKRSVTAAEERTFIIQEVPEDPEHIYAQVLRETNAGCDYFVNIVQSVILFK
jgi:hypothetical protein